MIDKLCTSANLYVEVWGKNQIITDLQHEMNIQARLQRNTRHMELVSNKETQNINKKKTKSD